MSHIRHAIIHPDDVLTHPDGKKRFADPTKGEAKQRLLIYMEHPQDTPCGPACQPPADRAKRLRDNPTLKIE